jgi:DNA-binding transcriptional ArsR family regulator
MFIFDIYDDKCLMSDLKIEFSEEDIANLAEKFKILSEPSRLKILRSLYNGERNVTSIIEATGLLQANVSKQLKILEKSEIVACRKAGLQRFYRVIDEKIFRICASICSSN